MDDEDEIVLACTKCRVTYLVSILDREGVGDTPIAAFCPYCGCQHDVTDAILAPISRELRLIPGGKQ